MGSKSKRKIRRKMERRKKIKEKSMKNNTMINHEFSVLATMSSGKSTVINALLGEDLLPNENQACTAKIFKIIDKDGSNKTKIKVLKDNVVEEVENISLEELNQDSKISEIIIEKDLEGIENKIIGKENHQICLIDTPGPNNSLETSHAEIAYKLLEDDSSTHLIYVLNGTQIGVNDDKRLLIDIIEKQKEINDNKEIIFVLNKMDEIDQETENIENIIINVKKYLENLGIKNPKIIPLSAYAAKLFKLGLNGKLNTRKERNDFKKYYSYFSEFQISNKEANFKEKDKKIIIGKDEYSSNEIVKRIYATGIIDLEETLEKSLEIKIKLK